MHAPVVHCTRQDFSPFHAECLFTLALAEIPMCVKDEGIRLGSWWLAKALGKRYHVNQSSPCLGD